MLRKRHLSDPSVSFYVVFTVTKSSQKSKKPSWFFLEKIRIGEQIMEFQRIRRIKRGCPEMGFALLATLSMVTLVTLLVLGLLMMSTRVSSGSSAQRALAEARANAILGMNLALGQLQAQSGADTRATAPADLYGAIEGNRHWVGVLDTLDRQAAANQSPRPLVGRQPRTVSLAEDYSIDLRATRSDWKNRQLLGWLVSSARGVTPNPAARPVDPVLLRSVREGSDADESLVGVEAARVALGNGALPADDPRRVDGGGFAYHVADENMKAPLQLVNRSGDASIPLNTRLVAAPGVHTGATALGNLQIGEEERRRVATLGEIALAVGNGFPSGAGGQFTAHSRSLLTNPRIGGLKMDLSAYLSQDANTQVRMDLRSRNSGFVGDDVSLVSGSRYALSGPVFGSMRAWWNMRDRLSGSAIPSLDPSFPISVDRQLPPPLGRATNQIAEGSTPLQNAEGRWLAENRSGSQFPGHPVHPVLVEARLSFDFVHAPSPTPGQRRVMMLLYPRIKLWNPYNATLNPADYMVGIPMRVTGEGVTFRISGYAGGPSVNFNLNQAFTGLGLTDPTQRDRVFVFHLPGASLGPGETHTFLPLISGVPASVRQLPDEGVPYAREFSAENVRANTMSSTVNNLTSGAFFVDTGFDFPADLISPASAPNPAAWSPAIYVPSQLPNIPEVRFRAEAAFLKADLGRHPTARHTRDILGLQNTGAMSSFPSLQSIYMTISGVQEWSAQESEREFLWDTPIQFFRESSDPLMASGNVFAPQQWARHWRFIRMDEQVTGFTDRAGTTIEPSPGSFEATLGSDYNARASLFSRSPLSQSGAFFWFVYTPWIRPLEREEHITLATGTTAFNGYFSGSPLWGDSPASPRIQRAVLYDLPVANAPALYSLGQLRHAPLSPPYGWMPDHLVLRSKLPPSSEPGATAIRPLAGMSATNMWNGMESDGRPAEFRNLLESELLANNRNQLLLYDAAHEVNRRLLDDFFVSGLPRGGTGRLSGALPEVMPHPRLAMEPGQRMRAQAAMNSLESEMILLAAFLHIEGGFNVNSTHEEAWVAVLSSLRDVARPLADGSGEIDSRHPFSRIRTPWTGGSEGGGSFDPVLFSGAAALQDADLRRLARAVIEEIRERGPSLTLADFVNRRLVNAPTERAGHSGNVIQGRNYVRLSQDTAANQTSRRIASMGVVDAALQRAGTNESRQFLDQNLDWATRYNYPSGPNNAFGRIQQQEEFRESGHPGIINQADILEPLLPSLVTRGDTFTIRSYGDVKDRSGRTVSRVWCEAVVERSIDFVAQATDGGSEVPEARMVHERWNTPAGIPPFANEIFDNQDRFTNFEISELNRKFGRRYVIRSFRWITEDEVVAGL